MFTGIIEARGIVNEVKRQGGNTSFLIASPISSQMKADQSVSHDGVCLTVTGIEDNSHWVTAVNETLIRSNLGSLKRGDEVNLERSMQANGRFDGHMVQGHVDGVGLCKSIVDKNGSWLFEFSHRSSGNLVVEKGSIAVNGVSLTCFNVTGSSFTVSVIPYTYEHTNLRNLKPGDAVNLEFDLIGKYVKKLLGESR